jgi:hypothetical protein
MEKFISYLESFKIRNLIPIELFASGSKRKFAKVIY